MSLDNVRQPQPVTVYLEGQHIDTDYWLSLLMRRAEYKGDGVQKLTEKSFRIYPRAVND